MTHFALAAICALKLCRVTIDISEDLARRVDERKGNWVLLIESGLRQPSVEPAILTEEIAAFLSRGPSAQEIVAFKPSGESVRRASELLEKNRDGNLTQAESADLDDLAVMNRLFSLIKANARQRFLHKDGDRE